MLIVLSARMSVAIPIVLLIVIAVIVFFVLDYYGNRQRFPWYVQLTCFLSFWFAFSIIVIVPLDLTSSEYKACLREKGPQQCPEPLAHVDDSVLYGFWNVSYWFMFNIQMFIVPVMQGYVRSGNFMWRKRVMDGIMENVYFYAACGAGGLILLIYAVAVMGVTTSMLMNIAIPATNAYGLALLTLLMGYGLVEFPRGLWFNADTRWVLKYIEYTMPTLKEAVVDAEAEVYEVARLASLASRTISPDDSNRFIVDAIMEKCPLALQDRHVSDEEDTRIKIDTKYLIGLHARIKRAVDVQSRNLARIATMQRKAFLCQDIIASYNSTGKKLKSLFWPVPHPSIPEDVWHSASWWFFVWIQPISMRVISVLCAVASVLIVWSESTFQITGARLSIPSIFFNSDPSYTSIELFTFVFVCYMCSCTYSTLLSLKLLDFYQVIPEHNTDEVSLLFVGAYLCKLTFPIIYNFLNMGGLADAQVYNSGARDYSHAPVFIQYLGPAVNLTPLLGDGYNDWMAHLILITCAIILLNLHARILKLFSMGNFFYEKFTGSNEQDLEQGKQILFQARGLEERRIMRNEQRSGTQPARARNTAELLQRYQQRQEDSQRRESPKKTKQGYEALEDMEEAEPQGRVFGRAETKQSAPIQKQENLGRAEPNPFSSSQSSARQQRPMPQKTTKNEVLSKFKSSK
ncbi:LMBR1-like membrane protein-domain-containing protein [Gorgonomyces haynaldii]|nr:LMBR1-like membrane protein-domain-containing protein [Gorgonomyces haynaldii]